MTLKNPWKNSIKFDVESSMDEGRDCTECKRYLLFESFSKKKGGWMGYRSICRECVSKKYFGNLIEEKEKRKQNYIANKSHYQEYYKQYKIDNKELISARDKARRRLKKKDQRYRPEYHNKLQKKQRENYKERVYNHYGRVCVWCYENDFDSLEIDHILNNGNRLRKTDSSHKNIYRHLVVNNFPPEFQVLCCNCNKSKHKNKGILPESRKDKYKILNGLEVS